MRISRMDACSRCALVSETDVRLKCSVDYHSHNITGIGNHRVSLFGGGQHANVYVGLAYADRPLKHGICRFSHYLIIILFTLIHDFYVV